ncbi:hypothetical protein [Leifsonia sp. P73]|uniref:hypothetical protein n=1 Tax=Leifsonia sp. P73 TaxID=3423959 RepID=UPI003DA566F7
MNDSKDETPHLISRRTVAKTAAWAAPAIALAAASPAHAASPGEVAMILFDADSYEVPALGTITITGTLVPAKGSKVPADIKFNVNFPGATGFYGTPPVVSGNTFSMMVTASSNATTATLRVSSSNYPAFTPGTTTVTVAKAGAILVGEPSYDVSQAGVSVRGTLEAPQGGTLPEDITLVASATDGFEVLIQPLVTGNTYELVVRGTAAPGTTGTLTVSSSSHPAYTPGTAVLTAAGDDTPTGVPQLVFNQPLYIAPGAGPLDIPGTIIVPPGVTLPSDITLTAQSAVKAWEIIGTPQMSGPDTFRVVISAPVERAMTYIMLWSPSNLEFGFVYTWVKNF